MSGADDKKKSDTASIAPLTYGTSTNFFSWNNMIRARVISEFGNIAAFVFDGKRITYNIDRVDTTGWSAKDLKYFEREKVKARIKEHESMILSVNRIFGIILSLMSPASLERVALEPEWKAAESNMDAKALWSLIVRTHQIQRSGVAAIDQANQAKKINEISQGRQETITAFIERFHAVVRGFTELGMALPSDSYQAARFVDALDDSRYVEFKNALKNNASLGIMAYPTQLSIAIKGAMQFTSTHVTAARQPKQENAFVVSTREKSPNRKTSSRTRDAQQPPTQTESRHSREAVTCKLCGQSGHYVVKCPHLEECARRVQQGGCGERLEREDVHLTMGEEDEEIVFCATEGPHRILGANDILLDNQATISVFHNKHLLTNIRRGRPVTIRGIDGRDGRGVIADTVGTFGPFGDVYLSPHASANVLSLSSLRDADFVMEFEQGKKFVAKHKESGRLYDFLFRETSASAKTGLFAMNITSFGREEEATGVGETGNSREAMTGTRDDDHLREAATNACTSPRQEDTTREKMHDASDIHTTSPTVEIHLTPNEGGSGGKDDSMMSDESPSQGGSGAECGLVEPPVRTRHEEIKLFPNKKHADMGRHRDEKRRVLTNTLMDLLNKHLHEERPRKARDKAPSWKGV